MKRFTITMFDVCQDFETRSWIAKCGSDANGVRKSLERLGFSFSEEDVASGIETFDVLVANGHKGSRSVKTFRTADEVRETIDNLVGMGHGFPEAQQAKLTAFFEGSEESYTFDDQVSVEVSISRCGVTEAARA
jgi:hypothetical protein